IGKVFDPNDFKYHLSGMAFIGFAASAKGEFDPGRLFADALSPMTFDRGALAGLAVGFGFTAETVEQISEGIRSLVGNPGDAEKHANRITSESRFYRSIKNICVFFFVTDPELGNAVNTVIPDIHRCLQTLSGGAPSLTVAAYYLEGIS